MFLRDLVCVQLVIPRCNAFIDEFMTNFHSSSSCLGGMRALLMDFMMGARPSLGSILWLKASICVTNSRLNEPMCFRVEGGEGLTPLFS